MSLHRTPESLRRRITGLRKHSTRRTAGLATKAASDQVLRITRREMNLQDKRTKHERGFND